MNVLAVFVSAIASPPPLLSCTTHVDIRYSDNLVQVLRQCPRAEILLDNRSILIDLSKSAVYDDILKELPKDVTDRTCTLDKAMNARCHAPTRVAFNTTCFLKEVARIGHTATSVAIYANLLRWAQLHCTSPLPLYGAYECYCAIQEASRHSVKVISSYYSYML